MKWSTDLRSAVFAAIGGNEKARREALGEGRQTTDCGQSPGDQEPNLPKGYSHIRDAIRALLTLDDVRSTFRQL